MENYINKQLTEGYKGILLFDSYHPTSLGKDGWKIYEKVFSPLRQFFARYKTFDVVSVANKTIQ